MTKTRRKNLPKNKTCKINYIPASDKDIKAIIDINSVKNNIKYLKKKTGTDLNVSHMGFAFWKQMRMVMD